MPLTSAGLVLPLIEELQASIEADQRAALGAGLAVGPTSVLGQLNGVAANQLRELLELIAAVYDSTDPDLATGAALDRLAALTGTARSPATTSTAVVNVTLAAGAVVAAGDLVLAVDGAPERTFANRDEIRNDDVVQAVVSAVFDALTPGPVEAPADSLTVISQPAAGVISATNPDDAVVGSAGDTDADLRARREAELFRPGTGTPDAIVVDVRDALAPDVQDVRVFENTGDVTDGDGLPPHSIEVLVYDGTPTGTLITDDAIAQAIWDARPAGIATFGTDAGTAIDVSGVERAILFSRPTTLDVYVELTLAVSADWGGAADEALVAERVEEFGATLGVGDDVILSRLSAYVLRPDSTPDQGVEARILDLVGVVVDVIDPPVAVGNLDVAPREIALLDAARVSFVYPP